MKKVIKGAKKTADIALEHKKKVSAVTAILIIVAIWFFWHDIVNIITVVIPTFFEGMYEGLKKNWLNIGMTIFAYKLVVLIVGNLSKRFFINRSVDRFKKSLIYSELDELLHIFIKIKSKDFKNKIEQWEEIPYIGFLISILIKFVSWIVLLVFLLVALFKFGLGKILLTKVLSAQFWSGILIFVMNIPGFFIIAGLMFWLWLETHIPWIPKFYYWISIKVRIILNPIWNKFIEPIIDLFSDIFIAFEEKVMEPIGDRLDNFELKVNKRLKFFIYNKKGSRAYKKFMKIVSLHNDKQLHEKEKKERQIRVSQFSMLRRKAKTLKMLKRKKRNKNKK